MAVIRLLFPFLLSTVTVKVLASPAGFPNWALNKRDVLADCLASANINTSLPTTSSWSTDTEAWNARLAPVPAAVVFPASEEEVSTAIQCAAASNVKVTTLGGNRSFQSMAFGRNDGALVINLVNMEVLIYDESAETLTYGGPVTISDAANFLWHKYSRALMHGRCPDVGMTGVGFGGGFGTLSRLHGTVLDDIIAVRVALANGTIVSASASENADVLWAVRGAAASIGSVLTTTIGTFPLPSENVVAYTIGFDSSITDITIDDNVAALTGIQSWAQSPSNVDNFSLRFGISTNSSLAGFYYGSADEFAAVSASLLQHLPSKMSVLEQKNVDFWASENLTTPGIAEKSITARRYFYITSTVIPTSHPLTNETAKSLFENTAFAPEPTVGSASGFVDLWGGKYTSTIAADASAWKHDNNLLLVRWDLRAKTLDEPFTSQTMIDLRNNFNNFVDAYKADGGVPNGFPNYRDAEWTVDETAEYLYGENWQRLREVKTALDPKGIFNADPQDVPVL